MPGKIKNPFPKYKWLTNKKPMAFILIFAVAGAYMLYTSFAATTPTVTVSNTPSTAIQTQLSTNLVTWAPLNEVAGAQTKFNSLNAPLVRLHIGDDGLPTMPEIKQGAWANSFNGYTETRPFQYLDELVNEVYLSGQQPLMNIKFAPDWQWSCYPNSIGMTNTQGSGAVKDLTFQTFAAYMARLVDYYNKGTMTTETGTVINNPLGTTHKVTYWELWNEPDLNNETPCAPSTGNGITYQQYGTMWNAVTAAMLKEDATLKFVGPATAGAQFGSSTTTGNQYVDNLMSVATTKPTAISFHGYGYWDNTVTDQWILDGDNSDPTNGCCGGVKDLVNGVKHIRASYPSTPVWLTEVNVNADWGNDAYKRPWSEFAAAWWATAFQQTAPLGAGIIHEYDVLDSPQFGLLDQNTGNPYISFYVFQLLDQAFPQGSTILSSTSDTSGILSLAVKKPNGHIAVLVVNRELASSTAHSTCGTGGVATPVTVNLSSFSPSAITQTQIDKNNVNCTSGFGVAPTSTSITPASSVTLNFPGYGFAVLDVTPGSGGTADTQAPTAPTSFTKTGSTSTSIATSWAASTDNVGVTGYDVYVNGTKVATTTSLSYNFTGLTCATGYTLGVDAYDAAGNKSTPLTTLAASTAACADTTPPTVSITAPITGATVSGTININAAATDNVAVASVQFQIDGQNLGSAVTASPYTASWDTTKATNGSHTITAVATDTSGNPASINIAVTVANADTTAPSTPSGLTAQAPAYNQVNLSWTASTDNVGVAGYYIVRGGTTIAQTIGIGTTYTDNTVSASTSYGYQVMAYDAAGNTSGLSNTASVTTPAAPDTQAPSAPTNLSATAVSSSQINLSWTASTDNVGVSGYDIYRGAGTATPTKLTTVTTTTFGDTGLAASASYSYYVVARDAAGNSSTPSSTVSATTQQAPITTGTLVGTTSTSLGGSALSNVTITLNFNGANHTYTSGTNGSYSIINLQAQNYTNIAYAHKFCTTSYQNATITAGQTTTLNVTLQCRK